MGRWAYLCGKSLAVGEVPTAMVCLRILRTNVK